MDAGERGVLDDARLVGQTTEREDCQGRATGETGDRP